MGKPEIWDSIKSGSNLHNHIVRIHDVLPPVVMDAMDAPGRLGQVRKPPDVVLADVAISPFAGSDLTPLPAKIGEVVPIIALADHGG